ncbi:MAG: hypothetical protein KKA60_13450 [Proteobacteria bacterium]|nr:hypothetical protein [Pseudomonadota bacterium]
MGRRDQWKQVQNGMFTEVTSQRSVEDRETVPDVACGFCKNFSENAYASDGRGYCKQLKVGSNIKTDPPVYVMEGDAGLTVLFNAEAAGCKFFDRMDFVDTDGHEVADPSYRRVQRQMEKKVK